MADPTGRRGAGRPAQHLPDLEPGTPRRCAAAHLRSAATPVATPADEPAPDPHRRHRRCESGRDRPVALAARRLRPADRRARRPRGEGRRLRRALRRGGPAVAPALRRPDRADQPAGGDGAALHAGQRGAHGRRHASSSGRPRCRRDQPAAAQIRRQCRAAGQDRLARRRCQAGGTAPLRLRRHGAAGAEPCRAGRGAHHRAARDRRRHPAGADAGPGRRRGDAEPRGRGRARGRRREHHRGPRRRRGHPRSRRRRCRAAHRHRRSRLAALRAARRLDLRLRGGPTAGQGPARQGRGPYRAGRVLGSRSRRRQGHTHRPRRARRGDSSAIRGIDPLGRYPASATRAAGSRAHPRRCRRLPPRLVRRSPAGQPLPAAARSRGARRRRPHLARLLRLQSAAGRDLSGFRLRRDPVLARHGQVHPRGDAAAVLAQRLRPVSLAGHGRPGRVEFRCAEPQRRAARSRASCSATCATSRPGRNNTPTVPSG